MLIVKNQNILLETSGFIIHGCNAKGGFGSGIAGQIRKLYPKVYKAYKTLFNSELPPSLGTVQIVKINPSLYVGNCITQATYGYDPQVKYADCDAVRNSLEFAIMFADLKHLALKSPKIGCGLGGLNWEDEVEPIYSKLSQTFNVDIEIYQL